MLSLFIQGPKTNNHEKYYWHIGVFTLTLGIVTHLILVGLFYWLDLSAMVLLNIIYVFTYLFCIQIYPSSLAKREYRLLGLLVYFSIISHSVFACYYLGMGSGFQFHIFTLMTLPFLSFQFPIIIRAFGVLLLIAVSVILELYLRPLAPKIIVNSDHLEIIKTINLLIFLFASSSISYFYSYALKQHQEKLTTLANIDQLTGLYNRRHLIRVSENEINNQKRTNAPLSLILIDIDNFKIVNDTLGHDAGDEVLKNISSIITTSIRPLNVAARWGGEEFVILLPNTESNDAKTVAERLRKNVENNATSYESTKLNITITLGCTTSKNNESLNELLLAADNALYKGKDKGKNQTVVI